MSLEDRLEFEREVRSVLRAFLGIPGMNSSGSDWLSLTPDGKLWWMRNGESQVIAVMIMGRVFRLMTNRVGPAAGTLAEMDRLGEQCGKLPTIVHETFAFDDQWIAEKQMELALKGVF